VNLITVHTYTLSSFTELLAIAAHVSSTIVAALFVVNDWSCDSYWYIFGFCRYVVGSIISRPLPTSAFVIACSIKILYCKSIEVGVACEWGYLFSQDVVLRFGKFLTLLTLYQPITLNLQ